MTGFNPKLDAFIQSEGKVIPYSYYMHLAGAMYNTKCVFCGTSIYCDEEHKNYVLIDSSTRTNEKNPVLYIKDLEKHVVACDCCSTCKLFIKQELFKRYKKILMVSDEKIESLIESEMFAQKSLNLNTYYIDKTVHLQTLLSTGLLREDVRLFVQGAAKERHCVICSCSISDTYEATNFPVPVGQTKHICSPVNICLDCDTLHYSVRFNQRDYMQKRMKNQASVDSLFSSNIIKVPCAECSEFYPITLEEAAIRDEQANPPFICEVCARQKYNIIGPRFQVLSCKCGNPVTLDFLNLIYTSQYNPNGDTKVTCSECIIGMRNNQMELFQDETDEVFSMEGPMAEKYLGRKAFVDFTVENFKVYMKKCLCLRHKGEERFTCLVVKIPKGSESFDPRTDIVKELSTITSCKQDCNCFSSPDIAASVITSNILEYLEANKD